ncbi:AraC family transcriptional regulator [Methylobacterium sp. 190mf]|uniref:helix-turn-helix domain-containing protein n=1 Tax=Methylobacterium sp. 190mf TaxID=1761798 RepID=UPI0011B0204B|nr:AraC family transcriptional regulator [Methylobacterium sp. 190mf]
MLAEGSIVARQTSRQAFLFPGAALFLGRASDQRLHSHRAFEIAIPLDGHLRIETARAPGIGPEACVLAPLEHHRIVANGRTAFLWVDPETRSARAWAQVRPSVDAKRHERLVSLLREMDRSEPTHDEAWGLLDLWRSIWLEGLPQLPRVDRRVTEVLDLIDSAPVPLANRYEAAGQVALSPSWFSAIFTQQVGMPLRKYLLWRRLLFGIRRLGNGASVTSAAVEAGFADGAHFSRVFRATFGCKPSSLANMRIVANETHPISPRPRPN